MKTTWTLTDGREISYTAELVLAREINADGDKVTVPCCEIKTALITPAGLGYVGSDINTLRAPLAKAGKTIVAVIGGKVAIVAETLAAIKGMVAEVEAAPEYQAHLAQIAANRAGTDKLNADRKRNGYCPRCGSYCYGDCQAN
jgi:hypothetical protein